MSQARRMWLFPVGLCLLLAWPTPSKAQATEEDPERPTLVAEGEPFSVTVDNRGFRDVVVYLRRGGIPVRLGLANSRRVSKLRTTCGDLLNRTNEFLLRSIAGETYLLQGAPLARCDQTLEIVIYPIGLDFSTVWVW